MAEGREETDVVSDILLRPFSRRTYQEKLEIVRKGRATPRLANLSQAGEGAVRHFQSINYKRYPWLTGSEEHCKLYCWECLLFATDRQEVWSQTGFTDLTCLSEAAMKHQRTAGHFWATVLSKTYEEPRVSLQLSEQVHRETELPNEQKTPSLEMSPREMERNGSCQTPPSVTVRVKPNKSTHSVQIRRGRQLKRANSQTTQGPAGKRQRSRCQEETSCTKLSPVLVILQQEMAAFLKLFDDDLISEFLSKDRCLKISDKYLLSMTFVYFKRAHFTIAEYTTMNFFIALYLANTMEEDDDESKYEIYPWALGKNWMKMISSFLKQHDKLWARMEFKAAVSKQCCDEVMAIVPSHFVWKRERSEHHGGAQRRYGDHPFPFPRGPSASPVSCVLCNNDSMLKPGQYSSSFSPFTSTLTLEMTPPRGAEAPRKIVESCIQAQ